jgi:hypothetical protein
MLVSLAAAAFILPVGAMGETIDRVVAYIDHIAITRRELDAQHAKELSLHPSRTRRQTLEAMINTTLMLRDARRLRLGANDDAELLEKYLDLKVRALVLVTDKDIGIYYNENRERMGNRSLRAVKPEIRAYLEELKYNRTLKEHIARLRVSVLIEILGE